MQSIDSKPGFLKVFCLFAASAILLTVIGAPTDLSILAWVAIVPFLMASSPGIKTWRLVLTAWLIGFIYWLGNLYWLSFVTPAGYAALCFYLGAYWGILSACIKFLRAKNLPLFLGAPILWVGAETLQGYVGDGVAWRFLAHSQYANPHLIQIADIFSAAGVTFLIAMVNGLFADLLIDIKQSRIRRLSNIINANIVLVLIIAAVVYGYWRIGQWKDSITQGPIVAAVQPNVPLEVKESGDKSQEIFADCLRDSMAAQNAGAKFIAWPETMVQAVLNPEVLMLMEPNSSDRQFDIMLREHTQGRSYVLVGAYGRTIKWIADRPDYDKKYNSAFMYLPDGSQDPNHYDKIHLVPFGEVVPFKQTIPWLHSILMTFTPYDYDYTLNYGESYTVFKVEDNSNAYRFGVLICYEDTVSYVASGMAVDEHGKKQIDWLVNISNDGWFVRFFDSKVIPSTELSQHAAICVFRAVENRVPILRSVNTGISCLIDSQGRIRDGFLAGNLPREAMERQGIAGWFADRIPIDSRVSFFSRHGQWLGFVCSTLFSILLAYLIIAGLFPAAKKR